MKGLMKAGYSRKLAAAIAQYPRERWTKVRLFQEERKGSIDPDYDPTPWCGYCRAKRQADCKCGPIADND